MLPYSQLPVVTLFLLGFVLSPSQASPKQWCIKARQAQRKGIHLDCTSSGGGGRIASVSVVGEGSEGCSGLTASMFVQMNTCLWKASCRIRKAKTDRYMVKLFTGRPAQCLDTPAEKFLVAYDCAAADVAVVDVLSHARQEVSESRGIVRSHEDHPWMYHRRHWGWSHDQVTLRNPAPAASLRFLYTIRKLKLMWGDALNVNWTGRVSDVTKHEDDVTNTTHVIEGAERVTFQLDMAPFSTGGEGFVLCFQWLEDPHVTDACSGMIVPGVKTKGLKDTCKGGKKKRKNTKKNRNKNGNKKNRNKKNRNKKNRNKKNNKNSKARTPRPEPEQERKQEQEEQEQEEQQEQ